MKREFALILLFLFVGSVIYALSPEQLLNPTTPDIIDPLVTSTRNKTHIDLQYYPLGNNQFQLHIEMSQIVLKKSVYEDIDDATSPEQFFNRQDVPDGQKILAYETKYINDEIGNCEIKNSKCDIIVDLKSDIFASDESCFEIYVEFDETNTLESSKTAPIILCRDKNVEVGVAFEELMKEIDTNLQYQQVCILLFIFIGFLFSALFVTGGNPLKYFDITNPRLPTAKSKIKIDINLKDNEIREGRKKVNAIKKNLDSIIAKLFTDLEKKVKDFLENKYQIEGKKAGWSSEKIALAINEELNKYMRNIKGEYEKILKQNEELIEKELGKTDKGGKHGMEALDLEIKLRQQGTQDMIKFFESKLKLEDFSEKFKAVPLEKDEVSRLIKLQTNYDNYILADMYVNLRSNLSRGQTSGRRIGKVRKFVESVPIVSEVVLSAEAFWRKGGSLETKTIGYLYTKAGEKIKQYSGKKRADQLFKEIDDDDFYHRLQQPSSPKEDFLEAAKREAKKKEIDAIKEDLRVAETSLDSNSETYNEDRIELLDEILKEKLKVSKADIDKTNKDLLSELEVLVLSDNLSMQDKKYIRKVIELYRLDKNKKKFGLKNIDSEFNNKIDEVFKSLEIGAADREEIWERHQKLIKIHREFTESVAFDEQLSDDEKEISKFNVGKAIVKPDNLLNNVSALFFSKKMLQELQNIPSRYLYNQILEEIKGDKKKLEEFDKEYGMLVSKYNPAERFDYLLELAEKKYKIDSDKIERANDLNSEIKQINVNESSEGLISGSNKIISYFDKLKNENDLLELGIIDCVQNPRTVAESYLEIYSGFDSKIKYNGEEKRIKELLETVGFKEVIGAIEKMTFSKKELEKLYGPDTPHTQRMSSRTEKLKSDYLTYAVFINHFNDSLEILEKNYGKLNLGDDKTRKQKIDKLREFFADSLSEYYEGNYSSDIFTKNSEELKEKEIIFRDKANDIFNIVSNSLALDSNLKDELINLFKTQIDLSDTNMKHLTKEIDFDNNKYISEKWINDSSLHRAEALRMPVLQQNIFKLRDYVDYSVSTYNKLHNIATIINDEKKDKVLKMNLYLGNPVENTKELSGQQIFLHLTDTYTSVLSKAYDLYFRDIYEKSRMELLEKELGFKVNSQVLYDILEGKFGKVRDNLSLDKNIFNDEKMKSLQRNLYGTTNQNMYNRVYHRGWESYEESILEKIKKDYNVSIDSYTLYDLLDGNFERVKQLPKENLKQIRKEILGSKRDTYDLMRSKGVEFLIGGNNPMNSQEVYFLQKAFDKFRVKEEEGKIEISKAVWEDRLTYYIEKELKEKNLKYDSKIISNVKNFFSNVANNGLILPGLEITAEAEMRFAWNIDIRSNYIPLYQLGDKERAFNTLISTFSSVLDVTNQEFKTKEERQEFIRNLFSKKEEREKYLVKLEEKLKTFEGMSVDEIQRRLGKNTSIILAKNIQNYEDFLYNYKTATDYQPPFKTEAIVGKVTNVRMPKIIKQEDDTYREVIIASDDHLKWRKFGFGLEREVNKYFVRFPMIGMMSESVSTFNTAFRSKDYFAKSLENYSSFDATNINEMLRNKYVSDLVVELYKDKWSYSNRIISGEDNLEIDVTDISKKISGVTNKLLISMEEQFKKYFSLSSESFVKSVLEEDEFEKLIQVKRDELEKRIETAEPDSSYLAKLELKKLNKEFENFKSNVRLIDELNKNKDSILNDISNALSRKSAIDLDRSYDKIINALTPFAGEYNVKYDLELKLMKKNFERDYRKERIEDYEEEQKLLDKFENKSIDEINSHFNENIVNPEQAVKFLEDFISDTTNKKPKDVEFAKRRLSQLKSIKESRENYDKKIANLEKEIKYFTAFSKNKDDWNEITERHLEKAKQIDKNDIIYDKLFATSSILFENFTNSYESLYKTRNLSAHTRKTAFGFPGNEYGGTQFAGPISSTPLQYSGTLGQTGNVGWFSTSFFPFVFKDVKETYRRRYAFNYVLSDVPTITSPMGVSSRFNLINYFQMELGMEKNRYGEYLNPLPEGRAPLSRDLLLSLFSKNIRGESRLSELLDFFGGSYRGTPGGLRDVYNYIAFKPNELEMDFKDKIYTYKDARSMKKSAEFLYDVGFYAPFTNNKFIAGREITLMNDIYYGEFVADSTFYPNRAMNLLSSAPHYSNPKYRNMAYGNLYKLTQTQSDMVREVIGYDKMNKTPTWYPLSIPLIPLMVGTAGLPFWISLGSFIAVSGLGSGLYSKTTGIPSSFKNLNLENYLDEKYGFYYKRGLYSSAYPNSGNQQNQNP